MRTGLPTPGVLARDRLAPGLEESLASRYTGNLPAEPRRDGLMQQCRHRYIYGRRAAAGSRHAPATSRNPAVGYPTMMSCQPIDIGIGRHPIWANMCCAAMTRADAIKPQANTLRGVHAASWRFSCRFASARRCSSWVAAARLLALSRRRSRSWRCFLSGGCVMLTPCSLKSLAPGLITSTAGGG